MDKLESRYPEVQFMATNVLGNGEHFISLVANRLEEAAPDLWSNTPASPTSPEAIEEQSMEIVEYYVRPFKEFLAREMPMKRLDGDFEKSLKQTATFFKMLKDVSEDSRALHKRKGLKFAKCKIFTDEYSFMGCEYEDEDGKFYIGIYPDEPLALKLWFDDNYKASKFNKANFTKENDGWYWADKP